MSYPFEKPASEDGGEPYINEDGFRVVNMTREQALEIARANDDSNPRACKSFNNGRDLIDVTTLVYAFNPEGEWLGPYASRVLDDQVFGFRNPDAYLEWITQVEEQPQNSRASDRILRRLISSNLAFELDMNLKLKK